MTYKDKKTLKHMANLQKGISAVRIYDESDKPIMIVKISDQCRRTREIMKGDFIKLSWESDEYVRLGTGCHIYYGTAELDKSNPAFYLLNPYEPTRKAEDCYTYEPEFHAREDLWQKYPACIYTYGDGGTVKGRELEWSFLGTPQDALHIVEQSVLNETGWLLETSHIGSVSEKGGTSAVDIQAQSMSIFEMLGKIAQALDTEWRYDVEQNRIILGEFRLDTDHYPIVTMKVGVDCDNPQVNQTNEDYFNRFYVFGSDKNIQQQKIEEISNSAVKKRLPLDSAKYPGGFMDLDILNRKDLEGNEKDGWNLPKGAVYTPKQTDKSKIFPKGLYFDDVYPSTKFYIKSILENGSDHKQYLRDENGNIIGDTYYVAVSLDRKSDNIWDGFDLSKILPGETIEMYWTSGILNGRKFSLAVHQKYFRGNTYFYLTPDQNGALTTPNKYLKPEVGDEVTFFGYDFGGIGFDNARQQLERTATKYLYDMVQTNKTYTIKGNVPRFERNCERDIRYACMPLGQQIVIDYGNGDVSEVMRVTKVDGALDIPSEMTITASAKADPKGALSALTETVEVNRRTADKKIEEYKQQAITYAQRNFTQVYETMNQINNYFGEEINTTKSMQMVSGDASLQIVFSKTRDFKIKENPAAYWDEKHVPPCFVLKMYPSDSEYFYVKHMTLGVNEISTADRMDGQRMVWRLINQYTEWENDEQKLAYLKCSKTLPNGQRPSRDNPGTAIMILSKDKMDIENGEYYYFLLGFLSSADATGARNFAPMYGYTEVLPGQITTDKIVSKDGKTYFDIANGKIGGNIDFEGNLSLETIYIKNGMLDAKGNPYYIGGISGAPGLPTIWTGLTPTTSTAEVDRRATQKLPLKITKEGVGTNIGCLNVVNENVVDVDGKSGGLIRISANSIDTENQALGALSFSDFTPTIPITAKTMMLLTDFTSKMTFIGTSRTVMSTQPSARTVKAKGVNSASINIPLNFSVYRAKGLNLPGGTVYFDVSAKFKTEYSTDNGGTWRNPSLWTFSFSTSVSYNYNEFGYKTAVLYVSRNLSAGATLTMTGTSLAFRTSLELKFTTTASVPHDSCEVSVKAMTVNMPMFHFSTKNQANILADGGMTISQDSDNFFKLYSSEKRLKMDFMGVMETREVSLSSKYGNETYYIICRRFGNIVFLKTKIHRDMLFNKELVVPTDYRPNTSLDFCAYYGYYGTLNTDGTWSLGGVPAGGVLWLTLTFIN